MIELERSKNTGKDYFWLVVSFLIMMAVIISFARTLINDWLK